jgi:4-amino-4-deoxy-L-arabinose transferase-like glycosyltransferase
MKNNDGRYIVLLFCISIVILGINLGVMPVNIMEARNFITAREMVQDGHWILTTLNGEPRYEKPPLPTWMTAFFGYLFGFHAVAILRVSVVLVTMLLVFYIYKFSLKLGLTDETSFHNGLILLTSFYVYFAGRDNQWDIYCHSFMIVSIYYLWKILRLKNAALKNSILGGVFLAFSMLSKGPVSLYALLLPFLISYGCIYKFNFKNKKFFKPLCVYMLIGLLGGLSWSVYIHCIDPEHLNSMAKKETARWINDYNSKSFFYYWNFFTQSGVWTISSLLALFYPYMKSKVTNLKAYRFTLLWTLSSLLLLSFIPEKKVRYILPTLIPLAINTGFYIEYILKGIKNKKDSILIKINFGLLGLVGIVYPLIICWLFKEKFTRQSDWTLSSSIVLFTVGITILIFLIKKSLYRVFYSIILLQCSVIIFVFPLAKSFLYNPNYKSVKELHRLTTNKMILYDYKYMSPEIVWDYEDKIPPIDDLGIKNELILKNKTYVGVLCFQNDTENLIKKFSIFYTVKKVSYVDLNMVPPSNKSYKARLARDFLVIYKKSY